MMKLFLIGVFVTCNLGAVLGLQLERKNGRIEVNWVFNSRQVYAMFGLLLVLLSFIRIVPGSSVGILQRTRDGQVKQYNTGVHFICPWDSFDIVEREKSQIQTEVVKDSETGSAHAMEEKADSEQISEQLGELKTCTDNAIEMYSEYLFRLWVYLLIAIVALFVIHSAVSKRFGI